MKKKACSFSFSFTTINPFAPEFKHLTNDELIELGKKVPSNLRVYGYEEVSADLSGDSGESNKPAVRPRRRQSHKVTDVKGS